MKTFLALFDFEIDFLSLRERPVAVHLDLCVVYEYPFVVSRKSYEAETLRWIERLHSAFLANVCFPFSLTP